MVSYPLDVRPILEETGGWIDVDDALHLERLEVGAEPFALVEPATFAVTVSNVGSGLVARGTVSAHVRATCSRCLCEFETEIAGEVEGLYLRENDEKPSEEDVEYVSPEGSIDLGPALVSALTIEAPFAPLHDEECAGLCAECGADLNVESCGCSHPADEAHPFAALKDLLASDGE